MKGFVTVEMNMMGQRREDVIIACGNQVPTYTIATAQYTPTSDQLIEFALDVINGKAEYQEVL